MPASSVAALLEAQLQSRFSMAVKACAKTPLAADEASFAMLQADSTASDLSWLGLQPAPHAIRSAAEAVWSALEATPFGVGAAQLGGPEALAAMVVTGLGGDAPCGGGVLRSERLVSVYEATRARLRALGLEPSSLHAMSMICAGGAPWAWYGLGGTSVEEAAQAQVELAQRHGIVFDLVPLFLSDFDGSLLGLAAGAATVLLARLRERDRGRLRVDGVLFACKGTLAVALAAAAYARETNDAGRLGAIVGFGTDLSQGFSHEPSVPGGELEPTMAAVGQAFLVLNSEQDDSVGPDGRRALETWSAASRGSQLVWYNMNEWRERLGWQAEPGHAWYGQAFGLRGAALKEDILARISGFLRGEGV